MKQYHKVHIVVIVSVLILAFVNNAVMIFQTLGARGDIQNESVGAQIKDNLENPEFGERFLVDMNSLFQRLTNKKAVNFLGEANMIYQLENGLLTQPATLKKSEQCSDNLKKVQAHLTNMDIPMLFVQAPSKIRKNDEALPGGVIDYSNQNIDTFLKEIKGSVPYLDLRKAFFRSDMPWESHFYTTDHHWNIHGAFLAFQTIANRLEKEGYLIDHNLLKKENYELEIWEDFFLGSYGRKTGRYYTGYDDVDLLIPKFDTDLEMSAHTVDEEAEEPKKTVERSGNFEETLIFRNRIEKDTDDEQPYYRYLQFDYNRVKIVNKLAQNDKKVLIVKDSFATPVAPFLSLLFRETELVDLRYGEERSLDQVVKRVKPDFVIYLYSLGMIRNQQADIFQWRQPE